MADLIAITKDGEAESIDLVRVKRLSTEPKEEILTLAYLRTELAKLNTQIQGLKTERTSLINLISAVTIEAEKVALKAIEIFQPKPEGA